MHSQSLVKGGAVMTIAEALSARLTELMEEKHLTAYRLSMLAVLPTFRYPFAIIRAIISVIVDTLYRQTIFVSVRHCPVEERLKVFPLGTHAHTLCAVILEVFALRISASLFHIRPYSMQSQFSVRHRLLHLAVTSARHRVSVDKVRSPYYRRSTTLALARPHQSRVLSVRWQWL